MNFVELISRSILHSKLSNKRLSLSEMQYKSAKKYISEMTTKETYIASFNAPKNLTEIQIENVISNIPMGRGSLSAITGLLAKHGIKLPENAKVSQIIQSIVTLTKKDFGDGYTALQKILRDPSTAEIIKRRAEGVFKSITALKNTMAYGG
jgi:hypothetical protein